MQTYAFLEGISNYLYIFLINAPFFRGVDLNNACFLNFTSIFILSHL
jgi:hypothetical protein